jgi:hypothetical protein
MLSYSGPAGRGRIPCRVRQLGGRGQGGLLRRNIAAVERDPALIGLSGHQQGHEALASLSLADESHDLIGGMNQGVLHLLDHITCGSAAGEGLGRGIDGGDSDAVVGAEVEVATGGGGERSQNEAAIGSVGDGGILRGVSQGGIRRAQVGPIGDTVPGSS